MPAIMFVCLGNICRSPAAEGVLRHLASEDFDVSSCGIGEWHVGQLPDKRMRRVAETRGVVLTSRAKQFRPEFLDEYDYILAADTEILNYLFQTAKTTAHKSKIHLITAFGSTYQGEDIPDPYYEGEGDFELVLDMLEDACEGLLQKIKEETKERP